MEIATYGSVGGAIKEAKYQLQQAENLLVAKQIDIDATAAGRLLCAVYALLSVTEELVKVATDIPPGE